MAEHYREHEEEKSKSVGKQLRAHRHHDTAHDAHKADNAHRRHIRLDFLEDGTLAQKMVAQKSDGNRRDSHIQDIQEHALRVHVNTRVGKPQHKQRSHNGRKQGRNHRHAHGIRNVALRQETHDIAGNASGTATDEDDAHRKVGIQTEHFRKSERDERHDGVLRDGSEQNVKRLLHQVPDIVHRNGEAHAQHDDAEDNGGNIPVDPAECGRNEECDDCACDNERGSVVGKQTAKSLDYLKHASNI